MSYCVESFLSNDELQAVKKELVHRHIAWLTALRYQLRAHKPWEVHLKNTKANKEFRETQYRVCEEETSLENAIKPYISEKEYKEESERKSVVRQASQDCLSSEVTKKYTVN